MPFPAVFPYSAIAHLLIVYPNTPDIFSCTGWIFAYDAKATYVATAAHCVYDLAPQGNPPLPPPATEASYVIIIPGRSGSAVPFGAWSSSEIWFDDQWRTLKNPAHDYAVLTLFDYGLVGRRTGNFGFKVSASPLLEGLIRLAGYPGDKPFGTMWEDSGLIAEADNDFLRHQIDTAGGSSGSPLWSADISVIGIHTKGIKDQDSGEALFNEAVRINSEVFGVLAAFRGLNPPGMVFLPFIQK